MFLLVIKLHIDMGLKAVLPGPQNALYVMLCYVCIQFQNSFSCRFPRNTCPNDRILM